MWEVNGTRMKTRECVKQTVLVNKTQTVMFKNFGVLVRLLKLGPGVSDSFACSFLPIHLPSPCLIRGGLALSYLILFCHF